jgi:hypothetical protein
VGKNPEPLSQLQCSRKPTRLQRVKQRLKWNPTAWFRLRRVRYLHNNSKHFEYNIEKVHSRAFQQWGSLRVNPCHSHF